jgi:hypothetical protein
VPRPTTFFTSYYRTGALCPLRLKERALALIVNQDNDRCRVPATRGLAVPLLRRINEPSTFSVPCRPRGQCSLRLLQPRLRQSNGHEWIEQRWLRLERGQRTDFGQHEHEWRFKWRDRVGKLERRFERDKYFWTLGLHIGRELRSELVGGKRRLAWRRGCVQSRHGQRCCGVRATADAGRAQGARLAGDADCSPDRNTLTGHEQLPNDAVARWREDPLRPRSRLR